jgi:2-oxoglutarate ferredoxin oxidoreductase subunit gamma
MSQQSDRVALQFCGFGGQGIVLSSIVFGSAAVIEGGMDAVQTQSYGSEARGGECQAELILSKGRVGSPVAEQVDILVAMSQMALDRYLPRLRSGGTLVLVSDTMRPPERSDVAVYEIPAVRIAQELGASIAANMVVLGFLQQVSGLISEENLFSAITRNVRSEFLEVNLQAARRGIEWASEQIAAKD